ncbi:TPA: AHH domain-containing protein [Vibrio parahaemolyticus]
MSTITIGKSPVFKKPLRPTNPSALELAIYNYQVDALKHYKKISNLANATKSQLTEIEETIKHLKRERAKIKAHARLQDDLYEELQQYRTNNKTKDESQLSKENHHPTNTLVKNLYAIAEPQPSPNHAAHHIVMGNGRVTAMIDAKLQMFEFGIGINDAINGVWLPRSTLYKDHYTTPKAPPHSRIHGTNYQNWIGTLGRIRHSEKVFKTTLLKMKKQIQDGSHPDKILEKKDVNWKPTV